MVAGTSATVRWFILALLTVDAAFALRKSCCLHEFVLATILGRIFLWLLSFCAEARVWFVSCGRSPQTILFLFFFDARKLQSNRDLTHCLASTLLACFVAVAEYDFGAITLTNAWQTVTFDTGIVNPVVFVSPITNRDMPDPCVTQVLLAFLCVIGCVEINERRSWSLSFLLARS